MAPCNTRGTDRREWSVLNRRAAPGSYINRLVSQKVVPRFGGLEINCGGFVHQTGIREQFSAIADALALAQGIVDTVREPVLVLDEELRVIAASRSFYSAFKVTAGDTQGAALRAGRR